MKKLYFYLIALSFFYITVSAQSNFYIGAAPVYEQPIGSISNRFNSSYGAIIFAGAKASNELSWQGSFSYSSFSKPNYDKLIKQVEVQAGLDKILYKFPLNRLVMDFKAATLMGEANYLVFNSGSFSTNLNFGFGFTNWTFKRQTFSDSLFAVLPGSTVPKKISQIDVPENEQSDWSGTIKAGINLAYTIAKPVDVFVLVNYKIIVGELWPALALDIENVSGIQFLQLAIGIKATF